MSLTVVYVNGVDVSSQIQITGLSISDSAASTPPAKCTFTTKDNPSFTPTAGQPVQIGLTNFTGDNLLFSGFIETANKFVIAGNVANVGYHITCVDPTWFLNRRNVFGAFTNDPESLIIGLLTTFTTGFTHSHVQHGWPIGGLTVGPFTGQTVSAALNQIRALIPGSSWYVDAHFDVHFFYGLESGVTAPATVTGSNSLSYNYSSDLSQVRTRVIVIGLGVPILAAYYHGGIAELVVNSIAFVDGAGNTLIGPDGLLNTFSSVSAGGGTGTVTIGQPASSCMSSGSMSAASSGVSGAPEGTIYYRVSFLISDTAGTALGETEPIQTAGVSLGTLSYPGATNTPTSGGAGNVDVGSHYWAVSYVTATGETLAGSPSSVTITGSPLAINLTGVPTSGSSLVLKRNIYRTKAGGATPFYLVGSINDNSTTTFTDNVADLSLGTISPAASTAGTNQVTVTVPVGSTGGTFPLYTVVSRRLHRTKAGGSTYYVLAAINDNTTTSYTDNASDANLTTVSPTVSSVGTPAGSASLLLASAIFGTGSGWMHIGSQYVYGPTVIPSSGGGSISAPIQINSAVTLPASLNAVSALSPSLTSGSSLSIFAVRNDGAAQAALAAIEGGDGIHENTVTDTSLSTYSQLNASGDAELGNFSTAAVTFEYETRDLHTFSGRPITVSIAQPALSATFTAKQVTFSEIGIVGNDPRRHVVCEPIRMTLFRLLQNVAILKLFG
jgi:hypothetical protein